MLLWQRVAGRTHRALREEGPDTRNGYKVAHTERSAGRGPRHATGPKSHTPSALRGGARDTRRVESRRHRALRGEGPNTRDESKVSRTERSAGRGPTHATGLKSHTPRARGEGPDTRDGSKVARTERSAGRRLTHATGPKSHTLSAPRGGARHATGPNNTYCDMYKTYKGILIENCNSGAEGPRGQTLGKLVGDHTSDSIKLFLSTCVTC